MPAMSYQHDAAEYDRLNGTDFGDVVEDDQLNEEELKLVEEIRERRAMLAEMRPRTEPRNH